MGTEQIKDNGDFQQLMDFFGLGIFRLVLGTRNKLTFANSTFCELLGYTHEEISKIQALTIFADKEKLQTIIKAASRHGQVANEEIKLKAKNKKVILCSLSLLAVKDDKGNILYFDGALEDISGQRRTERELRESKELFQTVFDNSAAAITVTDKNEKIIAWNRFAEKMLGMTKSDLFNKPVRELYQTEEWQRIRNLKIRKKGMQADIETKVIKKDGSLLDVNMSISIIKDSEGNIVGSIGIMNDTTKQKLAESKIKESENKIRIILDNSPVAITMTDAQERIISWNRHTEEMLGMTKKDLELKPVSSLYPAAEWKKIRKADIRKKGSERHFQTVIKCKNGKQIDIELSVNVLKDSENNIVGSVGIMQDITQQKKVQHMLVKSKVAAEEASNSKSMFLANMSHEVRTPMNTIIGMIDLTLDTNLSEEQRDNLTTVKDAADILLNLLNDILDLSRVEAGKIQLENIEINIKNILKSVCKGLSILAHNKGLSLIWKADDQMPESLMGDPVRIRQILVNLVNNAIKFTFKGKIEISVKINKETNDSCELQFSVKDEGVGIPESKLDSIFEDFTQADASTTRQFGGSGLGLAISRKLAEMMGGKIWVESEEFKGSTFCFTGQFNKVKARPKALKMEEAKSVASDSEHTGDVKELKILLAEDNIVNQKIAVRMLEKKGWEVKAAENGKQVLEYLDQESFDLILMDAQMPVLDGFETTQKIRKSEESTKNHIPIIALTARAMMSDRKKCLDSGMDGYVSKPIDRQKLYEAIEQYFKKGTDHE